MPKSKKLWTYRLVTPPGLSELAHWEAQIKLKLPPEQARLTEILESNRWLRIPDRILIKLGEFEASNYQTFTRKFSKIDLAAFANHFTAELTLNANKTKLFDSRKVLNAINTHRKATNSAPSTLHFWISIENDQVEAWLDTSGEPLTYRGLIKHNHTAPLRESLAASLVAMVEKYRTTKYRTLSKNCQKTPTESCHDPFGGRGTIAIEWHQFWKPIRTRNFSFEFWPSYPYCQFRLEQVRNDRAAVISDIDSAAIEAAKQNTEQINDIEVIQRNATDAIQSTKSSVIITNPPYGKRVENQESFTESLKIMNRNLNVIDIAMIVPREWDQNMFASHLKDFKLIESIRTKNRGIAVQMIHLHRIEI